MTLLEDQLLALAATRDPNVWHSDAGIYLGCALLHQAQGTAAAPNDLGARGSALPAAAISGMRRLIVEQAPTGYLNPKAAAADMFFGTHLAQATLVLRATRNLSPEEDARWVAALLVMARNVVARGELSWYANGNIAVGYALFMALVAKVTGLQEWTDRFEQAWETAMRPPAARFPGRGLVITANGWDWKQTDGSQQTGYLTEEGPTEVGFDTDYSVFTLSQLARLHSLTKDWKAGRMLRILWNTLSPLVGDDLKVDVSTGTRHPHPGQRWDFTGPGIPTLAALGDARAKSLLAAHWAMTLNPARYPLGLNSAARYAVGLNLTPLLARV